MNDSGLLYFLCTIIALLSLLVIILGWRRVLFLVKRVRGGVHTETGKGNPGDAGLFKPPVSDPGKVDETSHFLDLKEQLRQTNEILTKLYMLIQNNHAKEMKLQNDSANDTATNFLKLIYSYQSFANSLQSLLQRNLDALTNIAATLSMISELPAQQITQERESPEIHKPHQNSVAVHEVPLPVVTESLSTSEPFEDFIVKNKEEIAQASCKGIKNIQALSQQLNKLYPVTLDWPSDQVFILVNRAKEQEAIGKAFVLPGTYLGRPWVEWFEMPHGIYERVELTVEPATVTKDENGDWSLIKQGLISQQ